MSGAGVGSGVAAFAALLAWGLAGGEGAATAALEGGLGAVLVLLAASDLRTRRIPNRLVYPALALAIATVPLRADLANAVVALLLGAAPMLAVSLLVPGSLGGGDAKMRCSSRPSWATRA